jgi:hypothetical protein
MPSEAHTSKCQKKVIDQYLQDAEEVKGIIIVTEDKEEVNL